MLSGQYFSQFTGHYAAMITVTEGLMRMGVLPVNSGNRTHSVDLDRHFANLLAIYPHTWAIYVGECAQLFLISC